MTTATHVLAIAAGELGYLETPNNETKYGKWYGLDGQPWCAMFVSWVFDKAGLRLPASTSKGFAYTPSGAAWFQKQGRWHTGTPLPGDVVFFDWPGDGVNRISHVGIVKGARGPRDIDVYEGNAQPGTSGNQSDGGGVRLRHRTTGIVGYGRPAFTTQGDDMAFGPDQEKQLAETWARVKNLEAIGDRDINTLAPKIAEVLAAVKADAGHGGGAGDVDPGTAAEAIAKALVERLKD